MNHLLFAIIIFPIAGLCQPADELRKSIYFGGGSYYIDSAQVAELTHWLDSIPQVAERFEIELISHTDPIGGRRYNEWLSAMRSESVVEILLLRKMPESIIHRKDWGLENAVYSNNSYAGRRMNRRVDVILHPMVY
jgi:outer membrane protein OmpA-like peptidoglycan-associated protein